MDPERVRAYLQVACAGLGFDIGEVWYTSNESGSSTVAQIEEPNEGEGDTATHRNNNDDNATASTKSKKKIKFLQLYTSKSFDDRRSELVLPPSERRRIEAERAAFAAKTKAKAAAAAAAPSSQQSSSLGNLPSSSFSSMDMDGFKPLARGNSILSPAELDKHVLSPRLVDAISDSAEVVWANCSESGGLIGRSDMKLQTAVGMPVAMDNEGNMCIVVMFSPNNVQSSDDAVEYLQAIGKSAVSSSIPCLLPVMEDGNRLMPPPSAAGGGAVGGGRDNGGGGGVGDGNSAVVPHGHHHHHHHHKAETQDFGHGVKARFVSLDEAGEDEAEVHNVHEVTSAPKDCYGIPMLPSFAELGSSPNSSLHATGGDGAVRPMSPVAQDAFDEASFGVWSTVMGTSSDSTAAAAGYYGSAPAEAGFMGLSPSKISVGDAHAMNAAVTNSSRTSSSSTLVLGKPVMQERRKYRLEEFLTAFLGMSVFDAADVWIPCMGDDYDTLTHVTSVTATETNERLNYFKRISEGSTIKIWSGAVGRAFGSANPVWTTNKSVFVDSDRASAFEYAQVLTALAIPIHSAGTVTPSCVICCYSLVRSVSVPFVLKFVQQALRLLWEGLDQVEPHESVGRLWGDVAPADLGEMAADVEMQKAFLSKKRPHEVMSSQNTGGYVGGSGDTGHGRKSSLALQLEALQVPEEDEAPPPQQMSPSAPHRIVGLAPAPMLPNQLVPSSNVSPEDIQQQQRALAVQTQVQEAVRSIDTAVLWSAVTTNEEGTKRAHISAASPSPPPESTYPQYQSNLQQQGMYDSLPQPPDTLPAMAYGMDQPPKEDPQVAIENIKAFNAMAQQAAASQNGDLKAQQAWGNTYANNTTPPMPSLAGGPLPDQVSSLSGDAPQYCLPTNAPAPAASRPGAPPGGKPCRIQGCNNFAVARRPYCVKHSGNRLCEREGCTKCAQGSTRFCIAHGGGRRCTFPGCDKGARDKFFCAAHGGGKRCTHPGCTKSAVGGSNLCTSHGGGRRCAVEGCDKSAQSSTKFCVKHGGGKKCAHAGCTKVARGRTLYCAAHGGGIRCKLEGCSRVAIGKQQLCRAHGGGSNARRKNAPPPPAISFPPPGSAPSAAHGLGV